MTLQELQEMFDDLESQALSSLVVFQNVETGEIFMVQEVELELQGSDDGGNTTSLGATTFIRGVAY